MITAKTMNSFGQFESHVSADEAESLRVQAATAGKDQIMIYVNFQRKSEAGIATLSVELSDPKIAGGEPFQMSRLEGTTVVPMEMNFMQSGLYRVPVPAGSNENALFVRGAITNGDVTQDSLEFWITTNAYQPVSGMIQ